VVAAEADVVWPPAPTEIPGSSPDAETGHVATLGGNGEAVGVWDSCSCASSGVQASVFDSATWAPAQTISNGSASDAYAPQISATSTGHAVAVWIEDDGTDLTIQSSTYDGTWSAPVNLSGASTDVDAPKVSGRPDGSAVAVWDTSDIDPGGATDIQAATFDGASWTPAVTLTAGDDSSAPEVATTGAGTAVAVWTAGSCVCTSEIDSSTLTSGAWSPPVTVSTPGDIVGSPAVTSTGGGAAVAAWVNDSGSTAVIEASSFDGSSWGAPDLVSDPADDVPFFIFGPFGPPRLTSTGTGEATVVWVGEDDVTGDQFVDTAVHSGGAWAPQAALSPGVDSFDGFYLTPDVTTVEPGVALGTWQLVAVDSLLQAATYDGTTVIGPANVGAAGGASPAFPDVEGTGDGTAVTVWTTDDGISAFSIQAALGAPSAITKAGQGGDATLTTTAGGFLHVKRTALPASPPPPAGVQFPYGLLSFDIVNLPSPGASATVTVHLNAPVAQYWKLQHGVWTQLTDATINGNDVRFTLTDGGVGDADGVANGTIVDPGGPAVVLPRVTFAG
jgi:hypothetical protein